MLPKGTNGEELSTGQTYVADSMIEALVAFGLEHPEAGEPLYVASRW